MAWLSLLLTEQGYSQVLKVCRKLYTSPLHESISSLEKFWSFACTITPNKRLQLVDRRHDEWYNKVGFPLVCPKLIEAIGLISSFELICKDIPNGPNEWAFNKKMVDSFYVSPTECTAHAHSPSFFDKKFSNTKPIARSKPKKNLDFFRYFSSPNNFIVRINKSSLTKL